jgi:hypothetical protein
VVSLVSDHPEPPGVYQAKLKGLNGLSHVTVEVQACSGDHRTPALLNATA